MPLQGAERFDGYVDKVIFGDIAQLGKRRVRNAEVEGSIPFESTNKNRQVSTNRNLSIF